jgi:L-fucose isomerase
METKISLATLADSRSDFLALRAGLVEEELNAIDWLRQEFDVLESRVMNSSPPLAEYACQSKQFGAQSLIVHLPIWADPAFTVRLAQMLPIPLLLLGNLRPQTSSLVGLLGAGGALDQVGRSHRRVFDHRDVQGQRNVRAFVRAARTLNSLKGQTLGLFGGRSLGIFTAVADPAQWQKLFGVDIETADQLEIQSLAESLPEEAVKPHFDWLVGRVRSVRYSGGFTAQRLEQQVRSYLATRRLASERGFDFVGVKCQPELSDGYVSQCVAHLLCNSGLDASGAGPILVHACEADADGALTMQIMHLLSDGRPASLMDVRWYDAEKEVWLLANCGAVPGSFCATAQDASGLSSIQIEPHVFGKGGGGALPALLTPKTVTMARLCRRDGQYWMAILAGQVETAEAGQLEMVTPAFPKAVVRSPAGMEFLKEFGSNHLHLVEGEIVDELETFCELAGIAYKTWK